MRTSKIRHVTVLFLMSACISMFGCAFGVLESYASKLETVQGKYKISNQIYAKITAYTPYENGGSTLTASGTQVKPGIVAVSLNLYRSGWTFGKRVLIGEKIYVIQDILPSRNNGFDIYMDDYRTAVEYGVKRYTVYLLG